MSKPLALLIHNRADFFALVEALDQFIANTEEHHACLPDDEAPSPDALAMLDAARAYRDQLDRMRAS